MLFLYFNHRFLDLGGTRILGIMNIILKNRSLDHSLRNIFKIDDEKKEEKATLKALKLVLRYCFRFLIDLYRISIDD